MSLFPLNFGNGSLTGISSNAFTDGAASAESATRPLPLVLLHGIQGTAISWAGVMDRLPQGIPVAAPNLRGRGNSYAPNNIEEYGLDGFAADLDSVLKTFNSPSIVAGWSMGVLVALSHIQRYGLLNLRGLVLISGTACGRDCRWFKGESQSEITVEAEARAADLGLTESARSDAVVGAWLSVRETDLRDTLAALTVPTLVIHGSDDDQCPLSHSHYIAEQVPESRLKVREGGVHNLLAQDPSYVARLLAQFYSALED